MKNRVDWIDYAKGIGIILVVYGHVARGLYSAGLGLPTNIQKLIDSIVYSFHMPLFFFLSGLFFYDSLLKRGSRNLVFNKIDTIIYPYLIWSLLQGVTEVFLSNYTNGNVTLSVVLAVWEPRAQFWFLYILFIVFIVCTLMYSLINEKMHFIILIFAIFIYVQKSILPNYLILNFLYDNLIFFVFGIVFTRYKMCEKLIYQKSLYLTLVLFITGQYLFHGHLDAVYTQKGIESLILALISILFIVSLSISFSKSSHRYIALLGASSMAIYLMHILAGAGTRVLLSKVFNIESVTIHLMVGCIAGLILPLLALKIIGGLRIPYVFRAPISNSLDILAEVLSKRISK
ncbi:acyltransferase family protein [Paraglaciecola arctica]|uniref:acyltransferase family protein n=1 Tax=Paraglaciecola arctica TaxID=1128911 RepID=UPI001C06F91E|nr:acyltransferase [Paraglaciecola arctica]MBU3004341.1 acyltransferase [Paraglaciecola arctica]